VFNNGRLSGKSAARSSNGQFFIERQHGWLRAASVIDDDASMRRALTNLFQSVGLKVEVFG